MCTICGCGQHDHDHTREHGHSHDHHDHDHHHHHDNGDGQVTISVEEDILGENNRYAAFNRGFLRGRDVKAFNLVSSPGSGKTTLLESTIKAIGDRRKIAVVEGDQQTDNDARRISALGVDAVQINTRDGCHLDAHRVGHAIEDLNPSPGSLLFIENVGNLVCPAMFDLGENERVVVISVTEGDDKPLKYPYMFAGSQICIINKIDLLPYVDSSLDRIKANALSVNPNLRFFEVSSTKGTGLDQWVDYLLADKKPQ